MLTRAARLWRTIRHLKPVQFHGRIWFRLYRPSRDTGPAPVRRPATGKWVAPARRRPGMTGAESFRLLNEDGTLADGWDDDARAKLWRYNLHYFDDLNAAGAEHRRAWHVALIERWIVENPPRAGTGWEPYPTSLRIVNWVKWALAGNALSPAAVQSLAVQARWLMKRLEWHILGNHLFANAKALVFAGLYFEGAEAERWLARGARILREQLPEQILADGGQFELSPMYHALALEDVLDLVNISACFPGEPSFRATCAVHLPKMLRWLRAMCHPDGEIAFFNDAAIGIAPSPAEIEAYARRLGYAAEPSTECSLLLKASGYARMEMGNAVLLADVAQVGPDYLPGHGHADTLSFELSLAGQRLIVNSGTSVYGLGEERLRQRGTAAHNTVVIDGRNSSEVWSGFRVGRRALPGLELAGENILVASHDGYAHLPGAPIHRREWRLTESALEIIDQVTDRTAQAEARFHFHPEIVVSQSGSHAGNMRRSDGLRLEWKCESGSARIEDSSWHPEFGIALPSKVLVIALAGGHAKFELHWV